MSFLGSLRRVVLIGATVLVVPLLCFGQGDSERPTFYWKDGLRVQSKTGSYQGKFGGRALLDVASFRQQQNLEDEVGTVDKHYEWRRLRLFHSGQVGNFKYKTSVEFAKEYVFIEDLYVELGRIPVVGNIRAGHFKEPFLLEMQSSSKHVVFMERGVTTIFSSGRNLGIMLHDQISDSDMYYQLGVFSNGAFDVVGKSSHIGYNAIGRISGLVAKNTDRTKFIHVGLGVKQSWLDLSDVKFSAQPESNMAHKYISSGVLSQIKSVTAFSTELVMQTGSLSLQSEVVHALAYFGGTNKEFSPYYFPACYGQVSYVLTGEARNYKNGNEGFVGLKPHKNAFEGGIGAWEVAARYSYGDLESQNIYGARMQNTTLGLNWYPNPIVRISTNYIFSHVDDLGRSNIWQMRLQVAI